MEKTITLLETKDAKGVGMWIYQWNGGGNFYLDCEFDGRGLKTYYELPRGYKTMRGAKQAATLLAETKLTWSTPCA